jgi:hypothetical protein
MVAQNTDVGVASGDRSRIGRPKPNLLKIRLQLRESGSRNLAHRHQGKVPKKRKLGVAPVYE